MATSNHDTPSQTTVTTDARTKLCWNCDGTGRALVFNIGADAPTRPFVDGPCSVCSGRGRLAAND